MKAVSTRMLGMSGAFSTAKPACSTSRLVQRADLCRAAQHLAAEFQAVLDLRGGAHVQQVRSTCGIRQRHLQVDAAHARRRRFPSWPASAPRRCWRPVWTARTPLAPRASGW
jgi:hypothetical protein